MGRPEQMLTEEDIRAVFNIGARFEKDGRGPNTVRIFGAFRS